MKDRQPTKILPNGAIRYGVYGEDGTLQRYEYMKLEDEPSEPGTPLNKATLLSDETVEKVWPNPDTRPEDPTVNQAFEKLTEPAAKIGDIEISARSDFGDAWLRCDGRLIEKQKYPELFHALRTQMVEPIWTDPVNFGTGPRMITPAEIDYGDGLFVGVASNTSSVSKYFYTDNPLSGWIQVDTELEINYVKYGNGTWVAGLYVSRDTPAISSIAISDDPKRGWVTSDARGFEQSDAQRYVTGIAFDGRIFAAIVNGYLEGVSKSFKSRVVISEDNGKTWEDVTDYTGIQAESLERIRYEGGYWFIQDSRSNEFYVGENLKKPMTLIAKRTKGIAYSNGVWVSIYETGEGCVTYNVSTMPTTMWESRNWEIPEWRTTPFYALSITALNGRFYLIYNTKAYSDNAFDTLKLISSANPEHERPTWTKENTSEQIRNLKVVTIIGKDNILMIYYSTDDLNVITSADYALEAKRLPIIGVTDAVSGYIKAKEE